jgi:hypothetical protein
MLLGAAKVFVSHRLGNRRPKSGPLTSVDSSRSEKGPDEIRSLERRKSSSPRADHIPFMRSAIRSIPSAAPRGRETSRSWGTA